MSYQEIGEIRSISALTVRNAMSGIQRKLEFRTRQQLVVWAVRIGLVDGGHPQPAPSVEGVKRARRLPAAREAYAPTRFRERIR